MIRNSSSSDEERRHTPSPPGSNPHRVKRFVSIIFRSHHQYLSLPTSSSPSSYWQTSTPSPLVLAGLFLGRLTTRKTCALWEKNWRKLRMRQLTNGRFPLKCWLFYQVSLSLLIAKSILFTGTLTLTPGLQWKAGTAGRKPLQAMFLCPTFRLVDCPTG